MKSMNEARNDNEIKRSCDDPTACLEEMFVDQVQKMRVEQGQCPVRRPVFLRTHGILKGTMTILDNIPDALKKGMWNQAGEHPVYARYSSDLNDGRPDWKSTIGCGIKMFDIPGKKVVSDNGAGTADLLFQNVPFFFADNAEDFCSFTKASLEGWGDEWIQDNAPNTTELLNAMEKPIRSVLETPLWSVVPFQLGKDQYCKYILKPATSTFSENPNIEDPNFMGKELAGRLAAGYATVDIYIQPRPSAKEQGQAYIDAHFPLDKATVTWDEQMAKPIKVATIKFPKQDISHPETEVYGDWLAFNIGRVPAANKPVGSIAEARMKVYKASADYRRKKNDQPVSEPTAPGEPKIENPKCPFPHHRIVEERPRELTEEEIERIVEVKIHPGIGIARVGNSANEHYIGPEVMQPEPTQFGDTRDEGGAIKRQAARFRVYGYDAHGNVVAEVQDADSSHIEWAVHVANKKAQWYEFNAAMDIPATVDLTVPLRNPDVTGSARGALAIDPGRCRIRGRSMQDSSYVMQGEFQGTSVTLGELRTDSVGRLLVLPGFGVSASPTGKPVFDPNKASSFNNAAGWYDDICDGPVHAKVRVGDKEFFADRAWVCSAPPNFAPDMVAWRTLDDLLRAVYTAAGMMKLPQRISFNEHIKPILQRLSDLQWVNKGYLSMFGANGPMNFNNPEFMEKLAQAPQSGQYPDPYGELRRTIFNSFRPVNNIAVEKRSWPWNYGDAYGYTDPDPAQPPSPNQYLKLPAYYDFILSKWVEGEFESDYDPATTTYKSLDELPLQERPEMLDRANMHFCLADAFHPGAELTWPMRHSSMYRAPYRIRERAPGKDDPTYGTTLNNAKVVKVGGPLYAQGPGDLSRWMALPWQGDTAYCRSGYDMEYDPYVPTFWPARVPNQVLTYRDYEIVMDDSKSDAERIAAYENRASWMRVVPQNLPAPEQMEYMIAHFSEMGIVEALPGPKNLESIPKTLYVENLTQVRRKELEEAYKAFMKEFPKLGYYDKRLAEAGWFSEEQRNEFMTIKRRGN